VSWTAQSHCWQASCNRSHNCGIAAFGQHQRQRTWPKVLGEQPGAPVKFCQPFSLRHIRNMDNQRVKIRAPLCAVNLCHRLRTIRPRSKAVNCLGRQCDKSARNQHFSCTGDCLSIGFQNYRRAVIGHILPL
jgi:hypothetical protein